MKFGEAVGEACSTFAITNIDAMFVLITFFAEAASDPSTSLTTLKIAIGQYLGFSVVVMISMIGYGVAMVLPAEPIGFLGLLPIMMGVWKGLHLVFPSRKERRNHGEGEGDSDTDDEEEVEELGRWARFRRGGFRSIFTVALVAIMNGGDNIGTYIPLFSQAKGADIAIYVVIYYFLLGVWILVAWLVMRQRHVVRMAAKWAKKLVPILYIGLGIYIVVGSKCYPWSIEEIDKKVDSKPGKVSMGVSTAVLLVTCIATMVWVRWKNRSARRRNGENDSETIGNEAESEDPEKEIMDSDTRNSAGQPASLQPASGLEQSERGLGPDGTDARQSKIQREVNS